MEQPILINRNNMHLSPQEMETMARGFACREMEQARSQVVRDMEAMRMDAKRITDHEGMSALLSELFKVAEKGANNINKHMTSERTHRMVHEAAQQMDGLLHQEIGRRYVDGTESITSSSSQIIAQIITAAIRTEGDIALEMGKTLTEFVSVMLTGMIGESMTNWQMFKMWWNLQDQFDEAKTRGLAMYDNLLQNSRWTTPEITREYREELKKIINKMQNDYTLCYNGMGLKIFAKTMLTTCVASAGTFLALSAGGLLVGGVVKSNAIGKEAARYLMQMGRYSAYLAVVAAAITILIGGYNYCYGRKSEPEDNVQFWQSYL